MARIGKNWQELTRKCKIKPKILENMLFWHEKEFLFAQDGKIAKVTAELQYDPNLNISFKDQFYEMINVVPSKSASVKDIFSSHHHLNRTLIKNF